MKRVTLKKGENIANVLEKLCRNGKHIKTQVWFGQDVESELFAQAPRGSSNVPYVGVERKIFLSQNSQYFIEVSYKKEIYVDPDTWKDSKLYLVLYTKIDDKYYLFGAAYPEEDPYEPILVCKK